MRRYAILQSNAELDIVAFAICQDVKPYVTFVVTGTRYIICSLPVLVTSDSKFQNVLCTIRLCYQALMHEARKYHTIQILEEKGIAVWAKCNDGVWGHGEFMKISSMSYFGDVLYLGDPSKDNLTFLLLSDCPIWFSPICQICDQALVSRHEDCRRVLFLVVWFWKIWCC